MKKTVSAFALIAAAGAFSADIATAQDGGRFYAGANYTFLNTDVKEGLGELVLGENIQFQAAGLRGGYEFPNGFAFEVEASKGISDKDVTGALPIANTTANFSGTIDIASLFGAFGVYSYPLTSDEKLKVFGRAGILFGELEASGNASATVLGIPTSISGNYSEQESGPVFGGGLSYELSPNLFVRTDATYIGLDSFPTMAFGASIGLKF